MIGVILWSDPRVGSAVIMCEDHGDLAYFDGVVGIADVANAQAFDAGDLVEFDMVVDGTRRIASNPFSVTESLEPKDIVAQGTPKPRMSELNPDSVRRFGAAEIIPLHNTRDDKHHPTQTDFSRRG